MLGAGCLVLGVGCWVRGVWCLVSGVWCLVFGVFASSAIRKVEMMICVEGF